MYTNLWYWIVFILLILLAAFFSAAETSFASLNHIRIKHLAKQGDKRAAATEKTAKDFGHILTAVLIGNNIANISTATLSVMLFTSMFPKNGPWISTVFTTLAVLTFSEILPKTIAKRNAEKVALQLTPLLNFFIFILSPFIWIFSGLQNLFDGDDKNSGDKPSVTEEELKVIIKEIKEEGVLEKQESELVQSALDFDETTAGDILTPRVDMISVPLTESVEKIKDIFLTERYSRIPVFEENKDDIIGILNQKDFFKAYLDNREVDIKPLLFPPLFAPPTMRISELLKEFQRVKTHIALVADQHGGIDGIITLEDVLEELVGEIYDEDDEVRNDVEPLGDNRYRINGALRLEDAFEQLEYTPRQELEDQTVGAWMLSVFEKIPSENDSFVFEDIILTVEKMEEQRILSVIFVINSTKDINDINNINNMNNPI